MPVWQQVIIGLCAACWLLWLALIAALWIAQRNQSSPISATQVLRLLPDVVRLTRRLIADDQVPRGVRIRLALLLGYLLVPIDFVPDFIPVVGYADDAIIAALVIRSAIRAAGPDPIARHWPGDEVGLSAVMRLANTPTP